jgi:hypothetical protein
MMIVRARLSSHEFIIIKVNNNFLLMFDKLLLHLKFSGQREII